jgi:hypothetical protein
MSTVPNIVIRSSDNGEDIRKCVESEVDKIIFTRRLLNGHVSKNLKNEIIQKLATGA